MTFEEFGNELRQQRLAKNISLTDIANFTHINIKFLEDLEEGKFHILPATYIRAFLREYAQVVELDPVEVLQHYDALTTEPSKAESPGTSSPSAPEEIQKSPLGQLFSFFSKTDQRYYILGGILFIGTLLWFLYSSHPKPSELQQQEIPFEEVIKENELSAGSKPQPIIQQPASLPAPPTDSLVLEIATTDSVWINLVIDDAVSKDFLFPPNLKRTFRAANQFSITVGNAGAVNLRLNGKELEPIGKRGAVVRNKVFSRETLRSP